MHCHIGVRVQLVQAEALAARCLLLSFGRCGCESDAIGQFSDSWRTCSGEEGLTRGAWGRCTTSCPSIVVVWEVCNTLTMELA